jgi:predicted Zn-ribbon and HTH transcriptional regulator
MVKCKNCGHEFDDTKVPEVSMGAVDCPNCGCTLDQEGTVVKGRSFLVQFLKAKSSFYK